MLQMWPVAVADAEWGEDLFADDLTCERTFGQESDAEIMSEMQRCQSVVHQWGRDNRVAFDPAKE